jgi:hypothetical protein
MVKQGHKIVESALGALVRRDAPVLSAILEDAIDASGMAAFVEEVAGPLKSVPCTVSFASVPTISVTAIAP